MLFIKQYLSKIRNLFGIMVNRFKIFSIFVNENRSIQIDNSMIQNFLRLTAIVLISAGVIISCSKKDKEVYTELDFIFIDFDPNAEINIQMVEAYDGTLSFICQTKRKYGNTCYYMDAEYEHSASNIDIALKGVIFKGNTCGLVETSASAVIDLGMLNNGTYNIDISVGAKKFTGKLVVSSDSYEVNFEDNTECYFAINQLNKIPEHTIWGSIIYYEKEIDEEEIEEIEESDDEETEEPDDEELSELGVVESFFNELMELGAEEKLYNPGFYNAFYIDETGNITNTPEAATSQHFIFHYQGDIEELGELVKRYTIEYRGQINISIYTYTGEGFHSSKY